MRNRGRKRAILGFGLAVVLALSCLRVRADADAGVETVRFQNLGVRDGLSQPTATAMAQDADGFLWIGTQDGLDRYDGYGFRVYKHDRRDPHSLSDNFVRSLLVDRDGRLWVGTDTGGLSRYDPRLDRFDNYPGNGGSVSALAGSRAEALMQDRASRIWVATLGGALQWYDPAMDGFRLSACGDKPAFRQVHSLLELADGSVLIGSEQGLWRCTPAGGAPVEWRYAADTPLDVFALTAAADNSVWVATNNSGVFHFSESGRPLDHCDSRGKPGERLFSDLTRGLLAQADGVLWIATDGGGLAKRDANGAVEVFRHDASRPDSLASNRVYSAFRDRRGVLWFGTWSNGLSVYDPRISRFVTLRTGTGGTQALPGASVVSALANVDGSYWLGTAEGGGLTHFDTAQGVLAHYTHDPARIDSLADDFVTAIEHGADGALWVATRGGGLDRMSAEGHFEHHRHDSVRPDSPAMDDLSVLYRDHAGTLWVGARFAGLDRLRADGGFDHFRHDPADPASLGGDGINAVLQTRDGALWVALVHAGLDRLDPGSGRITHFVARADDPASISANAVTALYEDARGELWVGTQGGGLDHAIRKPDGSVSFAAVTTREGLAADAIGAIAEDSTGHIWVSTTVGISRYDPASGQVHNFGARDGALRSGYFIGTIARGPGMRVLFGGPAGATLFDPDDIRLPSPPQPVLTGLRVFNQPVRPDPDNPRALLKATVWSGGQVVLDYRQSMVSFEFAAPDASDPESIRYAYRLQPHDSAWIETDARLRNATYTRLDPGTYTLHVRAGYEGEAWSPHEAALSIRVQAAPWATPLARLGYFLLAALLSGLVWWRLRVGSRRQARVQESIRESEERLKLALWGSGGELWDLDLGTGALHRENRMEHLAASHGAQEETLVGYRPFVHADDLPEFERTLAEHLRGKTDTFELSYRTPDRNRDWCWLLTRGRVVERDADGRALRMAGTTHDISALKRTEEALRRLNEELESRVEGRTADLRAANEELTRALEQLTLAQRQLIESEKLASLGGLVAGIAHEINTPLGVSVTAASHLVEESNRLARLGADGEPSVGDLARFRTAAREGSEMILRNLQRADRLVKSFKQVAVDQSSEDRRVVELGACIDEILTTLGPGIRRSALTLEVAHPERIVIETAPGALYQIVSNLVMNSIMHGFAAGPGGHITIAVRRDAGTAVIDYRDDGCGMDAATRARIFEPFFTTRRGQGGSGLGMHIVYTLVTQLLKGTIRCESAPRRGVHFEIRLPFGDKGPDQSGS